MITAKNIHFSFDEDENVEALEQFSHKIKADLFVLRNRNEALLCSKEKKIVLHSGMATLQRALNWTTTPIRVTDKSAKLPNDFFANNLPAMEEFDAVFRLAVLNQLTREKIKAYISTLKHKARNALIAKEDTKKLIEQGVIPIEKASAVSEAKEFLEELVELNPDLTEDYVLRFRKARTERDRPVEFEGPVVPVTVFPGTGEHKRKHWWIYSHEPNFGKTYVVGRFIARFNGWRVSDVKNACGIPKNVQFLCFDEVTPKAHLPFHAMKSLTSGDASTVSLPRKSYGKGYQPRPDAQVIITGNHSPYEVYADWESSLARRTMSLEMRRQLEERFHIVRLDGSVEEDMVKYAQVAKEEHHAYLKQLAFAFYHHLRNVMARRIVSELDVVSSLTRLIRFYYAPQQVGCRLSRIDFMEYVTEAIDDRDAKTVENIADRWFTNWCTKVKSVGYDAGEKLVLLRGAASEIPRNSGVAPAMKRLYDEKWAKEPAAVLAVNLRSGCLDPKYLAIEVLHCNGVGELVDKFAGIMSESAVRTIFADSPGFPAKRSSEDEDIL